LLSIIEKFSYPDSLSSFGTFFPTYCSGIPEVGSSLIVPGALVAK